MSDDERHTAAELHLLVVMAEAWELAEDAEEVAAARMRFGAALDAAIAVDLVPATAREDWLAELDDEPGPPVVLSPAVQARVDDLLAGLSQAVSASEDNESANAACVRLGDALRALRAVGATDHEATEEWWRKANSGGTADDAEPDDWDFEDEAYPETKLALRGVVPGPTEPRNGVRLLSLECYTGGLLLRWRRTGELPPSADREGDLQRTVLGADGEAWPEFSDDVGTDYIGGGGGSSVGFEGDEWVMDGRSEVHPAVPEAARRVTVEFAGEEFALDVSGLWDRPAV